MVSFFREDLAYFTKTMLKLILQLLQHHWLHSRGAQVLNLSPCSPAHQLKGFGASSDLRCLQTCCCYSGRHAPVLRSVAPIKFITSQYIFLKMVHLMFFCVLLWIKYGFDGWICFYLHTSGTIGWLWGWVRSHLWLLWPNEYGWYLVWCSGSESSIVFITLSTQHIFTYYLTVSKFTSLFFFD